MEWMKPTQTQLSPANDSGLRKSTLKGLGSRNQKNFFGNALHPNVVNECWQSVEGPAYSLLGKFHTQ